MKQKESSLEAYFCGQVEKHLNGKAYKWTSPGVQGVPDRLIIYPAGVVFVELKREGEKPRKTQLVQHAKIKKYGGEVHTVAGRDEIDQLIIKLRGRLT